MKKKTIKVNAILASSGEILDYYSHFRIFQLEHHLRFENKILKVYPLWYILRKNYIRTFVAETTTTGAPFCSPNIAWFYFTLSLDLLLKILNLFW